MRGKSKDGAGGTERRPTRRDALKTGVLAAAGLAGLATGSARADIDVGSPIPNADVYGLQNFGATDAFTGYPLSDSDVSWDPSSGSGSTSPALDWAATVGHWQRQHNYQPAPRSDMGSWAKQGVVLDPADHPEYTQFNEPTIERVGSVYNLLVSGERTDDGSVEISWYQSSDALSWTAQAKPLWSEADIGTWGQSPVQHADTCRVGAEVVVAFVADGGSGTDQIGFATGPDLTSLAEVPGNPLIPPGFAGGWDSAQTLEPVIYRDGPEWVVYYTGTDGSAYTVGRASGPTLTDLSPDGAITGPGFRGPSAVKIGPWEYLTFNDADTHDVHLYWTRDRQALVPDPNNPIVERSASGWDSGFASDGSLFVDGGRFLLPYGGHDGAPPPIEIGIASLNVGP